MSYQSVFAANLFSNKVFLLTGGGSGIGRCCAHELSALGAEVIISGRSEEKLQAVVEEIRQDGGKADYRTFDIRDEAAATQAISSILEQYGKLDGLVNNAGGQFPAPLEKISKKGFQTVVENNLVGGFLLAREAYKQCFKQHGGAIINITADCVNGFPGMGHTGAARAGMENFTKTAAWEWGRFGVRVNAIAPGIVASSGLATYDDATRKRILMAGQMIPLNRIATEAEISSAICFLLSPAASFINGEIMHIDGGAQFGSSHMYANLGPGIKDNIEQYDGFHRSNLDDILNAK